MNLRVSDHAVLRYLERAGGFRIEELRAAIAGRLAEAVEAGERQILMDGVIFVVRGSLCEEGGLNVTTVLLAPEQCKRRPRRRRREAEP
ncbi:MAG: hypothetical protein BGP11_16070 [Rhodobacterales bacterium 65-51]|jgi:hypothetical protein|uniref:hypothetical protein n=1 Tax=uncultured Gemmobacter sp. TaxID=1095917 RepID=UPI00095E543A|nr:hypothetical protein [uncultured Gemmobacter sp.]OJY35791.1 MAG: hypothetical protein BGP11_16070 [Rhodobacterales bacterium 65-51]